MGEEILKSSSVFLAATLKFLFGPIIGYFAHLHVITTTLATIAGMMTSVLVFTYFGEWIKVRIIDRYFPRRKKITVKNEKVKQFWQKFGLAGIAAFTPLLLTPIGGTLLAVSSGSPKKKIILYMFISAVAWAVVFTAVVYYFGHKALHLMPDWMKPGH